MKKCLVCRKKPRDVCKVILVDENGHEGRANICGIHRMSTILKKFYIYARFP